jgi:glyoxylase-like metal-dependent hydrolase (beta-lactamase superfamily II)
MKDNIQLINEEYGDIYFIRGKGNGKVPNSNSLLIGNCLIDTGISRGYLKVLKQRFKISQILFSHWHEDHFRDNGVFSNVQRLAHVESKEIIENPYRILQLYDIENTKVASVFREFFTKYVKVFDTKIDDTFKGEDSIMIDDDLELKVIYTPGHCRGHCSFYEPHAKVAFLGDIDLSKFGPWYGGKDSNIEEHLNSIEMIKKLDIEIAITGHMGIFEGGKSLHEKLDEYKSIIFKREAKILEFFSETHPVTIKNLMRKNLIYANYEMLVPEFLIIMERTMIHKHIDRLIRNDIIAPLHDGYILR